MKTEIYLEKERREYERLLGQIGSLMSQLDKITSQTDRVAFPRNSTQKATVEMAQTIVERTNDLKHKCLEILEKNGVSRAVLNK